mgnify:CR=1 FL=1
MVDEIRSHPPVDFGIWLVPTVNPDGLAYVMQAYCVGVDPTITEASLPTLGARLALPPGRWTDRCTY